MSKIMNRLRARKDALRNNRGFSLVELAVVIVIIGILVAIAVPIFNGMEASATKATAKAAAANGAAIVAGEVANGGSVKATIESAMTGLVKGKVTAVSLSLPATGAVTLANFCVKADAGTGVSEYKGPACP